MRIAFVFVALLLGALAAPAEKTVWLKGDYDRAHVVIGPNASEAMRKTAELFVALWKECAHAEIEYSTENTGKIGIWLGREVMPADIAKVSELEGLGEQGFIVRTYTPNRRDKYYHVGPHLVIAGRNDAATRNGVYEFFDRVMGLHALTPDLRTTVLDVGSIPEIDLRYVPAFAFREVGYFGMWTGEKNVRAFREQLRLPGVYQPSTRRYPGLPLPQGEEYNIEFAGSHFLRKSAAWVLGHVETPDGELPSGARTAIWQADNGKPVHCWTVNRFPDYDPALDKAMHEDKTGEIAGTAVFHAAGLANVLKAEFPQREQYVRLLLPAWGPMPPEKITLTKDVIIQISDAECDFSRPLLDGHCDANRHLLTVLDAWSKTGATLFVSHHIASLHNNIMPFPNLHVLRQNLYAFAQYGVKGVYAEAWDYPEVKSAEFDRLRAYLVARLLWNPDQVVDDLIAEFVDLYYGAGGEGVIEMLEAYQDGVAAGDKPLNVNTMPEWVTPDILTKAGQALGKALKGELSPQAKARVNEFIPGLEYSQLVCPPVPGTAEDGTKVLVRPKSRTLEELLERLKGRGLVVADPRLDLATSITQDCGGQTPRRQLPYAEPTE